MELLLDEVKSQSLIKILELPNNAIVDTWFVFR